MINRPEYLAALETHRGKSNLIKAVTGVRRCGKSALLILFQEKLLSDKIPADHIISISLESIENEDLRVGKKLYNHVKRLLKDKELHYVFLDEVQLAYGYEDAVNSLRLLKNCDLYVTGSNSNILSGDLATRWAGRYVEIKILPLSFKEFASAYPHNAAMDEMYAHYLQFSSFPEVLAYFQNPLANGEAGNDKGPGLGMGWNEAGVRSYQEAIYNSIIVKDIMLQHGVKEMALLKRVIKCMLSNIGSETSINNMVNMLNNDLKLHPKEKKVYTTTLEAYINGLLNSYVFYKPKRYAARKRRNSRPHTFLRLSVPSWS